MDEKQGQFITEGLIIGYISLLGYLTAFAYEYGYLSFFNIPSYFIRIDLMAILISISAIASGLAVILGIASILSMMGIFNLKGAFGFRVRRGVILLIITLGFLIMSGFESSLRIVIPSLIFLLLDLGLPFIIHKKQKTIEDRFLVAEEADRMVNENDIIFGFIQKYRKIIFYLYIGFMIILFSNLKGESNARNQVNFLIPDNRNNVVIIKTYEDTSIGLEFDSETHLTKNRFSVMNNEQMGVLSLTKVGRLKPMEIK